VATNKRPKNSDDVIRAWLENQDAYTLHRSLRKRFARNPCTVTNVMYVWECDLLDLHNYAKYKDNYRYFLSFLDVFTIFLNMIPLKTKSGPSVASAFRSIIDDLKYSTSRRRSIYLRTGKGKAFINKHFLDMLRDEGGATSFTFFGTST